MIAHISPGAMRGELDAPASKSFAHRALIAAALADKPTELKGTLEGSADISATIDCLRALGATIEDTVVHPITPGKTALLRCGESGTTLRLLLPVVGAMGVQGRFLGQGRLPSRPIVPLVEAMEAHGAAFDRKTLPFSISGKLVSGEYRLPGDVSSQFISGLLFALPLLDSGSTVRITSALESAGYVGMTVDMLDLFSVSAMAREDGYLVPGSQGYRSPGVVHVEGDWSNAAFFLAAGAIGGDVTVHGLSVGSRQPDAVVAELLRQFGARVTAEGDTVRVTAATLRGMLVDVSEKPDLVPMLAVLGAVATGTTRLVNASRLRLKESDRLESTCAMIRALGGQAEERADELVIHGGGLRGGEVDSFGDHRIAMAAAIAATACEGPVTITGAEAVRKSYARFFADFEAMGGRCDGLDDR